jgi:redox-sensitive bicupin YhaK (pirin superfamily)
MFSGEWIEHQELNLTGDPARVIQIWFVADLKHRGLAPHYQQLSRAELPAERRGDATVHRRIGGGSPMAQHMAGRLTASFVSAGGRTRRSAGQAGPSCATRLGAATTLLSCWWMCSGWRIAGVFLAAMPR